MRAPRLSFTLLLVFCCLVGSYAWITPCLGGANPRHNQGATLTRHDNYYNHHGAPPPLHAEPSFSRRQWLSHVAGMLTTTSPLLSPQQPSHAAAAPLVAKPTQALCDPSVSVWTKPTSNRVVYIVGTAHISTQSATLVGDVVKDVHPEAVFVELDLRRIGAAGVRDATGIMVPISSVSFLSSGSNGDNVGIRDAKQLTTSDVVVSTMAAVIDQDDTIKGGGWFPDLGQALQRAATQAVGNSLQQMYRQLGKSGFRPGEEFVVAVREGQEIGAAIVLGDRDMQVSLQRLTQALAETDLEKLFDPDSELEQTMKELLPSGPPPTTQQEFKDEMTMYVEAMKTKENVTKIMGQLKELAPKIYEALVAERDVYMATGLDALNQFPSIVAVMGLAHVEGVEAYLKSHGWKQVNLKCQRR